MGRRTSLAALALGLILALAAPAAADLYDQRADLDARIDKLEDRIQAAKRKEGVLTDEISAVTEKIRLLQDDVSSASTQLDRLEQVLELHQRKLDRLNALYYVQTKRLVFLQRQYAEALDRLNRRLVAIYTEETPDTVEFLFAAASFRDLIDQIEFLNDIGRQDERIAGEVRTAKVEVAATRERTKRTRSTVLETRNQIAVRTSEQRAVRDRLLASRNELAVARAQKRETLAGVRASKEEYLDEVDALLAQSAALAAKIQAAQAGSSVAPVRQGSGAYAWPVSGPVTSYYGWRWGRMHEGIDIAVPSGTPVVASASGTVIVAGWTGGYGNLVVVDHGGGVATAYGHNTSLAVGVGQSVGQGQVLAYAGSTGNSTGPNVHFEVRVNGGAVDPLGYL